jgi:hypothetical protein
MANLSLEVECFGGSTIDECCEEAMKLANRLEITVMFQFNEVKCMACPGDDAKRLASDYYSELKSKRPYKLARGTDARGDL